MLKQNSSIRNEVRWIAFSWALFGMAVCFNFLWDFKKEILAGHLPISLGLYLGFALGVSGFGVFKGIRAALLPLLILLSLALLLCLDWILFLWIKAHSPFYIATMLVLAIYTVYSWGVLFKVLFPDEA